MTILRWRPLAASATGASHARAGACNADAQRFAPYGEGGLALLVADGLGSAPEAPLAAHAAVALAARSLRAAAPAGRPGRAAALAGQRDDVRAAVLAARSGLHGLGAVLDRPVADLGTTLLVCVLSDAGATFGGVGDGFLAIRARLPGGDHRHHLLTLTAPGPFANETETLGSGAPIVVEMIDDPDIDGVALATDGFEAAAVERPLAADRTLRTGLIDALLSHADGAEDSAALHRDILAADWDRAAADDRSIVMAVNR